MVTRAPLPTALCTGDLGPLDTAIMNASVSIDRVIWIIVIGPSCNATLWQCLFSGSAQSDAEPSAAALQTLSPSTQVKCDDPSDKCLVLFFAADSARQDAGCRLGFVI